MINIKELKNQSVKYPEPLKSIIEMSKNTMSAEDFIDWFLTLRQKARELDANKNKQEMK